VKTNTKMLLLVLVQVVVSGLILFLAAGTFYYWQLWVLLVVSTLSTGIPTCYLLRTNPVALQRRMRAGPTAETRMVQKVLVVGWYLSLAAMYVVGVLGHRFGWSPVPTAICLVGAFLVAVGMVVQMLVVIQNSHAASTVRVESDQKLVSTGLYGLVRHPMYAGIVIMMFGIPLALGSYWGLVFVISGLIMLAIRIRDEEKLLQEELDGYRDYTQEVRYRVVPYMW
jgi:protein-S-isoprenylcysteine O-methyltransferase Ste14